VRHVVSDGTVTNFSGAKTCRTLKRDQKVGSERKMRDSQRKRSKEEAICHTAGVQDASEDV
jgi:hypothetical protein